MQQTPGERPATIRLTIDSILIACSLVAWTLPAAFGMRLNWGLRTSVLVPVAVILLSRLLLHRERFTAAVRGRGRVLSATFGAIWVIAFLRTALRRLTIDTLYIIGYLAFLTTLLALLWLAYRRYRDDPGGLLLLRFAAMMVAGSYVLANVVAFALGVRQPDLIYLATYPTQMLSWLGVNSNRTLFPFADGINAFGIISGMTLAAFATAAALGVPRGLRWLAGTVVVCSLIAMIMTDSRGALVYSAVAFLIGFAPRATRGTLRWLPLAASFVPIALILTWPQALSRLSVGARPGGVMSEVQRSALELELCAESTVTASGALSNRPIVWETAIDALRPPKLLHLVGYGFRGQEIAGVSEKLSCVFLSYVHKRLVSTHNIWLQAVFDVGYIGAAVMVGLAIFLVRRLSPQKSARREPVSAGMLSAIQYILLAGALEATLSPDFGATFVLFVVIATTVIAANVDGAPTPGPRE